MLPEHSWCGHAPPRSTCDTPWSVFRKVFFTDEMVKFACEEFNHYPKTLAAKRTRPHYVAKNLPWPPKWVNEEGREGPMKLTPRQYMKYILILYLLGAKRLNECNLDDLFSNHPIMQEKWLKQVTNRRDFRRFLRQVTRHKHTNTQATWHKPLVFFLLANTWAFSLKFITRNKSIAQCHIYRHR